MRIYIIGSTVSIDLATDFRKENTYERITESFGKGRDGAHRGSKGESMHVEQLAKCRSRLL